ncbi:hypothetical protein ABPG72_019553 [Tetrahymena utriculariae]
MPDQMKDFIQANYLSKKHLREAILFAHDKQKKDIEIMRKKNMKDQFEFEKNLLVKIRKIQQEKDHENELDKKQELISKNNYSIQESPIKKNLIQYKFSKKISFEEKLAECPSFNQLQSKQFVSYNYLDEQHQIQHRDEEDPFQSQIKIQKFNELILSNTQKHSIRTQKSLDSDELLDKQNEKFKVLQGDSNQQNMVLFHQLRSDVNEKIKKEGGYKKDINFGFYYERELQYNDDKQQMEMKKCNPYPFKLIANNKHLKQLETRLKQKKFQFADAQGILSKTKYYQAKEKNELSLKQMIEEGLTKSKFYHDLEPKQNKKNQQNQSMNKQSFSQMLKRSFEKEKDQSQDSQHYMQKKVGISNLFKDEIKACEYGSKIENTGRNLFACSHKIKLHSVLKRISDNYQQHPEYYEDDENLEKIIKLSKNNSDQQYKFYQISQAKKSSVETRKILNRSPVIRKLKIVQYSVQHGGGVSIPSNKRHIIESHPNQLNKVRPSSDEARYNKSNNSLKQVNRYFYQKDSFVMQSSAQSFTKNEGKKYLSPQNENSFKANKLSVKYMQFQQQLPKNDVTTQEMFQLEGNHSQGVQRLHSSQKHRGPKNTITSQKFKENSKHSEFSFVNSNQTADLNISKENSVQKKILMKSSSFYNNLPNKEHTSPQQQTEFKVQNNDDISFSQQCQQQSLQIEQSQIHEEIQSQAKQEEQIQQNASNKIINTNDNNNLKQLNENISDSNILLQKNQSQNSLKSKEINDQFGEGKSKKNINDNSTQKQLSGIQTKEQIGGNQDKEQIINNQSKDQLGDCQTIEQIGNFLDKKQLSESQTYETTESNQKKPDENKLTSQKNSKILNQNQSLVGSKVELSNQINQSEQYQKENSLKLSSKKSSQKKLTLSTEVQGIQQEQKEQESTNIIGDINMNQKLNAQQATNHDIKDNSSSIDNTQESIKQEQLNAIQKQSKQNQQQLKQSKKQPANNSKKQTKKKQNKQDKSNIDEPKKQSQNEIKIDEKK